MGEIKHNKAKCKLCGDIVESMFRHHMNYCSCRNMAVDGGKHYLKRVMCKIDSIEDLTEYY